MPRLKYKITRGQEPYDVTPDSPGPLFHLTEWEDWQSEIEPFIDGAPHRWQVRAHFDAPIDAGNEVVGFKEGYARIVIFTSEAQDWTQWKRDYYKTLQDFIKMERRRLAMRQAFLTNRIKRRQ